MKLLDPIVVGQTTLKNRLMFPPLTTGYEGRDGSITPRSQAFYTRLAKGGVGYIVIGDVNPVQSFSPTPRLFDDSQIPSFMELAKHVQAYGSKLGVQIFYPEYDVEAIFALAAGKDMGAVWKKIHYDMEHFTDEVTEQQLNRILDQMTACAVRAQKAGIDAIQIHGDRLLGTLCSTKMNHRQDQFGGSLENRTRFARMVVQSIRKAVPEMILDYKLSVVTPERGRGGVDIQEALQFAKWLQQDGVDMLHVAQANHTGNMADTIPPMGVQPYGFFVEQASQIRQVVDIPVSCVGRIVDPQMAEQILFCEKADIVALGRPLLCDPDWIEKLAGGTETPIRRCISCNKGCTDAIQSRQAVSCILNPENGHELERSVTKAQECKQVAVIGAGPAGLEAARVAALRGHQVTLWEKESRLGGQLNLAAVPPRKDEMKRAIEDLTEAALFAGVKIHLAAEQTPEKLLEEKPDVVLLAVGAASMIPAIPGSKEANVCDAWKILSGTSTVYGRIVVIGGGLVGCETAEYLAHQGHQVTIVEMTDQIASGESATVLPTMMEHFRETGVQIQTGVTVQEIKPGHILASTKDGILVELACDFVVMAIGAHSVTFDTTLLEQHHIPVVLLGDCKERPADIGNAITSGYDAACAI